MKVNIEIYEGNRSHLKTWDIIELNQVEAILVQLDGEKVSTAYMESAFGRILTVGGGPTGFLVFISAGDEIFFELINPNGMMGESHDLVIGGQLCSFEDKMIVDYSTALKAMKTFFSTGETEGTLCWIKK